MTTNKKQSCMLITKLECQHSKILSLTNQNIWFSSQQSLIINCHFTQLQSLSSLANWNTWLNFTSITHLQVPLQMAAISSLHSLATGKKSPQTQPLKTGVKFHVVFIALLTTFCSDDSHLFLANIKMQHEFPVNNHFWEQKMFSKSQCDCLPILSHCESSKNWWFDLLISAENHHFLKFRQCAKMTNANERTKSNDRRKHSCAVKLTVQTNEPSKHVRTKFARNA